MKVLVADLDDKDELKRLVRFWPSKSGDNQTSPYECINRVKEDLDKISFVSGEGEKVAEIAPAIESTHALDPEVLFVVKEK